MEWRILVLAAALLAPSASAAFVPNPLVHQCKEEEACCPVMEGVFFDVTLEDVLACTEPLMKIVEGRLP